MVPFHLNPEEVALIVALRSLPEVQRIAIPRIVADLAAQPLPAPVPARGQNVTTLIRRSAS